MLDRFFGIGEVRADMFFVDAHRLLGKRREDRLAYALARALGPFPMPGLDAIALVKEVAMGSQSIKVADFIGAQAAFSRNHDHGVVTRSWEFLLVVANVLQTHKVVELEQLFTREDEALLFLIERASLGSHIRALVAQDNRTLRRSTEPGYRECMGK